MVKGCLAKMSGNIKVDLVSFAVIMLITNSKGKTSIGYKVVLTITMVSILNRCKSTEAV